MDTTKIRPSYVGKERKEIVVLTGTWKYGATTVGLLSKKMMADYVNQDRVYKLEKDLRVRDDVARVVQKLVSQKLLRRWPKYRRGGSFVYTLTERAERLLDEWGYPYQGYAKNYGKSDGLQSEHHLMVTEASMKFEDSSLLMLDEVEVFPGIEIPCGEKKCRTDSLWKLGGHQFTVECERSWKSQARIEGKMTLLVRALKDGSLRKLGLDHPRCLYLTEERRQMPRLQEIALKTESPGLFYFTHRGAYADTNMITSKIWELADGRKVSL